MGSYCNDNCIVIVLAAHNGLKFHFAFLVSEMKRHGMDRYHFDDIRFTDTLQILRTVGL